MSFLSFFTRVDLESCLSQTRRVACNINKPFNFSRFHTKCFTQLLQSCVYSVGDDGMLRLWDRRASQPLQTHVAHDSWYNLYCLLLVLVPLLNLVSYFLSFKSCRVQPYLRQVLRTCYQSISRPTHGDLPAVVTSIKTLSLLSFTNLPIVSGNRGFLRHIV